VLQPNRLLKRGIKARFDAFKRCVSRRHAEFCERFPRTAKGMGLMHRRRRPLRALFMIFAHTLGFFYSLQAVMQTRTE